MRTFLYFIWFGVPTVFMVMALFSQLEIWSGKAHRGEAGSSFRQGLFVLLCSFSSFFIDQYFLEDLVTTFLDPFVPLILAQIILFPIILFLAAKLVGGTKPLQIQSKKAQPASRRKRR